MLTQQFLSISLQHMYSPNNKRHNQTLYGTEMSRSRLSLAAL
jgi:hypothetical protein